MSSLKFHPPKPKADAGDAGVRRREFLKVLGVGGVGTAAALAGCSRQPVREAMPFLVPALEIVPGVSVHYASTCTACPAACGQLVTVRDGRPIKLEGHPEHPATRGGLCAMGQADLRALYHAERLAEPRLDGAAALWPDVDQAVRDRLISARRAGKAVYVLSGTITSPTARRVIADFLRPLGGTLVEHDPGVESASAALEAYDLVAGRALLPALNLEKANVLVTFGADLLGTGPEPVAHTAGYAARKRDQGREAFRHVHVGGALSLTGAAADERWSVTAAEQRVIALALLARIAERTGQMDTVGSLAGLPEPAGGMARVDALAKALLDNRTRSLVVSGASDRAEQVAVAMCNEMLANLGHTADVERPSLVRRGLDRDLDGLRKALDAGTVGALFVLDLDPVAQLPDGEALAKRIRALPLSVCLTDVPTETSKACAVVAAAHHGLESWGDAMPRPGLLTVVQPTVRPLFDTRHPMESFLTWGDARLKDYRQVLMETWANQYLAGSGHADAEAFWTAAVSSGQCNTVARAELPEAKPLDRAAITAVLKAGASAPVDAKALEVALITEVAVRDGSRAYVPWLRELPDPLTRVAWTPCVRVGPGLAKAKGLEDGHVVQVIAGGATLELPVKILPGQHPRVLGVSVGYPEANAWRMAAYEAGQLRLEGLRAELRTTGRVEPLPLIQIHMKTEGRPILHQVSSRDETVHAGHHGEHHDLWESKHGEGNAHWEMAIDLDACTGCSACVVACQAENNIPIVGADEVRRSRDMAWLRIDRYFEGDDEDPDVLFEPMLCQQCDHAPCETVCPVLATMHSHDGLNQQVYNRCVGTRYCANNCPYKVRRFNWLKYEHGTPLERLVLNPDVVVRERGVMEKCTFCVQRIQAGRIQARKQGPLATLEVQTACQQSCPASAISFGDGTDRSSKIFTVQRQPRAFKVLEELGVMPSVTYLARVRNRPGAGAKHHDPHAETRLQKPGGKG